MAEKLLRDFVIYGKDGRLAAVVRNESCGGVFRGHADVWFGETRDDGKPVLVTVLASDCVPIDFDDLPLGE